MRAVLQRVSEASVTSDSGRVSTGPGLVALVAVKDSDTGEDARYLAGKTVNLRIFPDSEGKLNLSLLDTGGEVMAVSQFTLYGDCRRGRRPGFSRCAKPDKGLEVFNIYVSEIKKNGVKVKAGFFGKHMDLALINDGPVTLILES